MSNISLNKPNPFCDLNYFRSYTDANKKILGRSDAIQFNNSNSEIKSTGSLFQASTTDKAWALGKRSDIDKEANNEIRATFLNAVLKETNLSLNDLPKEIKSALNLKKDYSFEYDKNGKPVKVTCGKPLTAYRMNQVFKAVDKWKMNQADQLKKIANIEVEVIPSELGSLEENKADYLISTGNSICDRFDKINDYLKSKISAIGISMSLNTEMKTIKAVISDVEKSGKLQKSNIELIERCVTRMKDTFNNGFTWFDKNAAVNPEEDYTDEMYKKGKKMTSTIPNEKVEAMLILLDDLESLKNAIK